MPMPGSHGTAYGSLVVRTPVRETHADQPLQAGAIRDSLGGITAADDAVIADSDIGTGLAVLDTGRKLLITSKCTANGRKNTAWIKSSG